MIWYSSSQGYYTKGLTTLLDYVVIFVEFNFCFELILDDLSEEGGLDILRSVVNKDIIKELFMEGESKYVN